MKYTSTCPSTCDVRHGDRRFGRLDLSLAFNIIIRSDMPEIYTIPWFSSRLCFGMGTSSFHFISLEYRSVYEITHASFHVQFAVKT